MVRLRLLSAEHCAAARGVWQICLCTGIERDCGPYLCPEYGVLRSGRSNRAVGAENGVPLERNGANQADPAYAGGIYAGIADARLVSESASQYQRKNRASAGRNT